MKQLYYSLKTLIRGRGSNTIKIISLTLGLCISILLFARVAFEMNYNTGYVEPDNLCIILGKYTIGEVTNDQPSQILMGPVPQTIGEGFPDEIEYAEVILDVSFQNYFIGDINYNYNTILGDSAFFQTLGIPVLQGNVNDLTNPDVVFISEKFAKKAFGGEDPMGKTMLRNKKHEVMIKGIFKDVPENSSVNPDVLMSFASNKQWGYHFGWGGGDSYRGFVRLRNKNDIDKINKGVNAVIEKYMPFQPEKDGWGVKYEIQYAKNIHTDNPEVKRLVTILSVLAIAILLIAALNYVLISVSSLAIRSKGIGIHKCNGASAGNIFAMFMWETAIIIGISILLIFIVMFSFKEQIEDLMEVSLASLFVWKTLWVPLLIILILFIIAGILPGRMFSSIPVSQVFRRYTERKQNWKRPLLFVQFAGVSFIFGLLCVVVIQYRQIINYDLGYNPEGVATSWFHFPNLEVGKATIGGLPMVEAVATSGSDIAIGFSGEMMLGTDGKTLFSTRFNACDSEYLPLLGIKIKQGKNLEARNQVVVNEEFIRRMRWTDDPIGKHPSAEPKDYGEIVGVMEDFVENSLFSEKNPVLYLYEPRWQNCVTVRLKAPYRESFTALNKAVKEIYPSDNMIFTYLPDRIEDRYNSVRRFRDIVILAFISILLITIVGLLGYVNDEIRSRSKEIAIRKVNGAEAPDILSLLSIQVSWVAIPAVLIGACCSYFIGKEWLVQFNRLDTELHIPLFILVALGVLVVILGSVIAKAWSIANENPVTSIKSE